MCIKLRFALAPITRGMIMTKDCEARDATNDKTEREALIRESAKSNDSLGYTSQNQSR